MIVTLRAAVLQWNSGRQDTTERERNSSAGKTGAKSYRKTQLAQENSKIYDFALADNSDQEIFSRINSILNLI